MARRTAPKNNTNDTNNDRASAPFASDSYVSTPCPDVYALTSHRADLILPSKEITADAWSKDMFFAT